MASNFTAIYDACVLYPAPMRDLLMQLALTDLFRARWTERIHDEWMRNVLKNRPDLTPEQLTRTKELMNSHVRDCLITNYEYLIPQIQLPDPDDCHVLAAAIVGGADAIVTTNLSDFPQSLLDQYDIEAQHPDDFISNLLDLKPSKVAVAAKTCQQRLKNPPKSWGEMSSDTESYAKELMSCFQYYDRSRIKLYQLKSLKFRSLKALLYRINLLHQIAYRLFGT